MQIPAGPNGVGGGALWPGPLRDSDREHCFHIFGFDVILDGGARPYLLEVNTNPSLGIDSVFPTEGPAAASPPAPGPRPDSVGGGMGAASGHTHRASRPASNLGYA